ncbi:Uu.00g018580.m01.CDS01 [Anthostomella pinea]|uniref:Uu.00g018580.m01.CDS01 n=1 Tax=Anthostomella pinea TaxID=933095 RepID=A0AAI8VZS3_9PEZI|nr:Uu.00g018580.m01.CDS01 [Anthostomella pinea]
MAAVPFKVKSVYEYTSNHEDDLPFGIGQIITVTEEDDPDWYGGEYVDDSGVKQEGIFPRNFVEKFEPTAPPRPTRARKKEAEPAATARPPQPVAPSEPSPVDEPAEPKHEDVQEAHVASPSLPAADEPRSPPVIPVANPPETAPVPAPVPIEPKIAGPVSSSSASQPPPKLLAQARAPPPVSEKPSGNSFKDRIAAFNKPAAPPVAPFKPSGLSSGSTGFIKKPFVAPPPSRNAYVPPPREAPATKVYRRDEDPEIKEREVETMESAEKAGLVPTVPAESQGEDQPKPTTLKERIALLQKQQAEAAQRHADTASKKDKPKRPPKKRTESGGPQEGTTAEEVDAQSPLERRDTAEVASKKSLDEPRSARQSLSLRRKSTGLAENDGNEADMSGAGDTTEGQEDFTEREDSDEKPKAPSRAPTGTIPQPEEPDIIEEDEEGEEDDDVDPELKRKQELRARMAKMSGGMGMAGMFGPPSMSAGGQSKKPKATSPEERRPSEPSGGPGSPRMTAPPVPTMMALPGMGKQKQAEEEAESDDDEPLGEEITPVASSSRTSTAAEPSSRVPGGPPPVPGGRPAPPPVPAESRPPPPPPARIASPSVGSESDDELSEAPNRSLETPTGEAPPTGRAPPPIPSGYPAMPSSPRATGGKRSSYIGDDSPVGSPRSPPQPSKRNSRPPPPVPGAAPPLPAQSRPPPPPPPGGPLSRTSTADRPVPPPMQPGTLDNGEEGENTDYEGDYDTDIGSSVTHKDALKAHARDPSFDEGTSVRSPAVETPAFLPPPVPSAAAPRTGPPPVPSQPAPSARQSIDAPRAAPPPPPPSKEAPYGYDDEDYDPYNYNAMRSPPITVSHSASLEEEPQYSPDPGLSYQSPPPPPPDRRGPPPAQPPTRAPRQSLDAGVQNTRASRQSLDVQRTLGGRRSMDASRPSMETGYMANDVDLAPHTQWWLSRNGLPPVFQGRRDIYFECDESTASAAGGRTSVTKEVFILFQDYSQTMINVHFDPQNPSDAEVEQRHEGPPRALRQDQLEEAYERFGRQLASAAASKKDSVVGDGTPQSLIFELLRPLKDALLPVGTRAYGGLVYANLANASTQLHDEIRPGDIISIRNAKFQGKHGPMHAKYSAEVGKPDHVAIVAEWDGTKKKVRAWEQGRESKKVKQESFKLEDLRSGEVKIWRVMPRSWVGWSSQD